MFLILLCCSAVMAYISQRTSDWVSFIQYGDRAFFWKDKLTLHLIVWNMVRGQINDELNTLTLTWSCTDLSTNKLCLQYDGQDLFLDDFTYTIQLSEQSLSPLRSYLFEVTIKGELEAKHSVVLYASQNQVPLLNLLFPMSIFSRYVNYDEFIDFNVQLDAGLSPDDVKLTAMVILNGQVQEMDLLYPRLRFRAVDFLAGTIPDGETTPCTIVFRLTNPNLLEPAQYMLRFDVNTPPRNGLIVLPELISNAAESTIILGGGSDTHQPLVFKFYLYLNSSEYTADVFNKMMLKAIDLTDFSVSQALTGFFPDGNSTIVCAARDSYGATYYYMQNITVADAISDFETIIQQSLTEVDVTKLILRTLTLVQKYRSMSYADKLKYVKQMDQLKTVIKDTREKVKTTSLHLTSGLDKSLKYIDATGVGFLNAENFEAQLKYLIVMQTDYRRETIQLVIDIQKARTNMIFGQLLGNVTAQDIYLQKVGMFGPICSHLDGVFKVFDDFLGRMEQDTPLFKAQEAQNNKSIAEKATNATTLKELFDKMTKTNEDRRRRLLFQEGQTERADVKPNDSTIYAYRLALVLNSDYIDIIHICYKRLVSLTHILNLVSNEIATVNGMPIQLKYDYFNLYFTRVTLLKFGDYIVKNDYAVSFNTQDTLNYSDAAIYSGVWDTNNDTIDWSVKINESSIGKEDSNYEAIQNIYMWENRDLYTDLEEIAEYTLNPTYLYLISIVQLPVNPYYWQNEVYSFARWNAFAKKQKYISPSFMVQNGSEAKTSLRFKYHSFKWNFLSSYESNNTRCVSIVSNFTGLNCTKKQLASSYSCICNYFSDVTLLEKYNEISNRRILFVTIDNMHLTVIGQTVFGMSAIMILFMAIAKILDVRSMRVTPMNALESQQPNDGEEIVDLYENDRTMQLNKTMEQTTIGKNNRSQIYPTEKELGFGSEKSSAKFGYKQSPILSEAPLSSKQMLKTKPIGLAKFKVLKVEKNINDFDVIEEGKADAACQYEPIFNSNIELGIKYTTGGLIGVGVVKLHELVSIFLFFDPMISRLSRMLSLYMKLMVVFVFCSYTFNYLSQIAHIVIVILTGECSVFFINVVKAELNGTNKEKLIGLVLTLAILSGCWMFYFFEVRGLDIDLADQWARQFIISYLANHLLFDPIVVVMKILLYPWTLKQMVARTQVPMAYLLYFLINHADIRAIYKL